MELTPGEVTQPDIADRSARLLGVTTLANSGSGGAAVGGVADGTTPANTLWELGFTFAYNGASWDRLRTPNVFKTGFGQTVSTTIWTPTLGKKFRLMRFRVTVTSNMASATPDNLWAFTDGGVTTGVSDRFSSPAAAAAGNPFYSSGWVDLGNGLLSAAANNVLAVSLAVGLSSGFITAEIAGTEE